MGKFWSTLGTCDDLVYAVMAALIIAFIIEAVIILCNVYDDYRYGDEYE